jgi:hypothetical protein
MGFDISNTTKESKTNSIKGNSKTTIVDIASLKFEKIPESRIKEERIAGYKFAL